MWPPSGTSVGVDPNFTPRFLTHSLVSVAALRKHRKETDQTDRKNFHSFISLKITLNTLNILMLISDDCKKRKKGITFGLLKITSQD